MAQPSVLPRKTIKEQSFTQTEGIRSLPWIIGGLDDDGWRKWAELPPRIPENLEIDFSGLVSALVKLIDPGTLWSDMPLHTAARRMAVANYSSDSDSRSLATVADWILGLRTVDFIGSKIGLPLAVPTAPRFVLPDDPDYLGRGLNLVLLELDKGWPSIVKSAHQLHINTHSRVTASLDAASEQVPTQKQHLFYNFSTAFGRDPYQNIISNFKLAAFALGWHCQGMITMPNLNEILKYFSNIGFQTEVDDQRKAIATSYKGSDGKPYTGHDLEKPWRLASCVTPFALLLTRNLVAYSYSSPRVIEVRIFYVQDQIFHYLGNMKPPGLKKIEQEILNTVWQMSQGTTTAELGLGSLFNFIAKIEPMLHPLDFNWFGFEGFPPFNADPAGISSLTNALTGHADKDDGNLRTLLAESPSGSIHPSSLRHASPLAVSPSTPLPGPSALHSSALSDSSTLPIWFDSHSQQSSPFDPDHGSVVLHSSTGTKDNLDWFTGGLDSLIGDPEWLRDEDLFTGYLDSFLLPTTDSGDLFLDTNYSGALPLSTDTSGDVFTDHSMDSMALDEFLPAIYFKPGTQAQGLDAASSSLMALNDPIFSLLTPSILIPPNDPDSVPRPSTATPDVPLELSASAAPEIQMVEPGSGALRRSSRIGVTGAGGINAATVAPSRSGRKKNGKKKSRTVQVNKSSAQNLELMDLTGSEITKEKNLIKDEAPGKRDPIGIRLWIVPKEPKPYTDWETHTFRSFNTVSEHPTAEPVQMIRSMDYEYEIIQNIQRNIVIQAPDDPMARSRLLPFAAAAFARMGIPMDRKLEVHNAAHRTANTPQDGLKVGDAKDFLHQVAQGEVLGLLDLPLDGTSFPDPPNFEHLNTNEIALLHTRTLDGCQWLPDTLPDQHTKFGLVTATDFSTTNHLDYAATGVYMQSGSKTWNIADHGADIPGAGFKGSMDTIHAFKTFTPYTSGTDSRNFEGVTLVAGDIIIWGHLHICMLDQAITGEKHDDTYVMFIHIFAFWFHNLDLAQQGDQPVDEIRVHLPIITAWRGVLQILTLGNLIILLEALNHQNYLDLGPNSKDKLTAAQVEQEENRRWYTKSQLHYARKYVREFQQWFPQHYEVIANDGGIPVDIRKEIFSKSVVHLATVLTFYKQMDLDITPSAILFTPEAFKAQLIATLMDWEPALVEEYTTAITQPEPPCFGRFTPWADDDMYTVQEVSK
ncbi:hypothetical protein DFH09DRAFT_1390288 [Mycena vulgaris]|nr:hypothetical protein DFH09DRAFT_1390288 [Mycena vulgaris]